MFPETGGCIPHAHLENFYSGIGYMKVTDNSCPSFLNERANHYLDLGHEVILMKREHHESS